MINSSVEQQSEGVNWISVRAASTKLGVSRPMMYYYIDRLHIQKKRFPLDRKVYIPLADVERIRQEKQAATQEQR